MSKSEPHWIYGRHAVSAALENPSRRPRRLLFTENAKAQINVHHHPFETMKPDAIDAILPAGAVHQGAAGLFEPLADLEIEDVCATPEPGRTVIVLDQITDPQNIGAIIRSAAAFDACALIVHDRKTPPFSGVLAKAAAGGVETTPLIRATNIARALDELKSLGYFIVGLAGDAGQTVVDVPRDAPLALVLGAEGAGMRRLTMENCDLLVRIPMSDKMESLNVSAAAAVALYEFSA